MLLMLMGYIHFVMVQLDDGITIRASVVDDK